MSSAQELTAFLHTDIHTFDGGYTIHRFDDDPYADLSISISVGPESNVKLELTDEQAAQLGDDLLEAADSAAPEDLDK